MLTPTGSGSRDHIPGDAKIPPPAPIPLKDGVYEVGRSAPADILLPIPTVSTRHALLRVGEQTGARGAALLVFGAAFCSALTHTLTTPNHFHSPLVITTPEDVTVYVTDLSSTNGTLVDLRELSPLETATVAVGQEITFGDAYLARFQLELAADPAAAASAAAGAGVGLGKGAFGAASGGSSGSGGVSGTVVLPPEDSGDAAAPAAAAGGEAGLGGGGGMERRRQKKQRVDGDFIY